VIIIKKYIKPIITEEIIELNEIVLSSINDNKHGIIDDVNDGIDIGGN